MYKELVEKYAELKRSSWQVRGEIRKLGDGFRYMMKISSYGSSSYHETNSLFEVIITSSEYPTCGEKGFVDVFTNNESCIDEMQEHISGTAEYLEPVEGESYRNTIMKHVQPTLDLNTTDQAE